MPTSLARFSLRMFAEIVLRESQPHGALFMLLASLELRRSRCWNFVFALLIDLNRNVVTEKLGSESADLRKKLAAFRKKNPNEDHHLDLEETDQTIESVLETVTDINKTWQTKRDKSWAGKVGHLLLQFGCTLHSHKTLLEMLPQGSEYVSIFTGSLNAVIKVCPESWHAGS
jgi:hypothetical protein